MIYPDWVPAHNSRHRQEPVDVKQQLSSAFKVFVDDLAQKLCEIDFEHNKTDFTFEYAFHYSWNLVRIGTVNESLGIEGLRCVLADELSSFRFRFRSDVINEFF